MGSYQTAWTWIYEFRRSVVRPGRDRPRGSIEADAGHRGGEKPGVSARETAKKAIAAIAVEVNRGRIARVRLRRAPDLSASGPVGFLTDVVVPGSTVNTDGWCSQQELADCGFNHDIDSGER